jgi:hypothetical protein
MSSRVWISIWAFLFGGVVVFGLISTGTLEPVSLGRASLFDQIVFMVIAGMPLIAWFVVFFRTPG